MRLVRTKLVSLSLVLASCETDLQVGLGGDQKSTDTQLSPSLVFLEARVDSDSQMTLTWSENPYSETRRLSYQAGESAPDDCSSGNQVRSDIMTATSIVISDLNPDQTYSFAMCAVDQLGLTISRVEVSAKTFQSAPPEPINLTAFADSYNQITLNWSTGGGSTAGYRIAYLADASGPASCNVGTQVSKDSISGTTHVLDTLRPGRDYSFLVCSVNGNASPDYSSGARSSASMPLAPAPPDVWYFAVEPVSGSSNLALNWSSGGGSTVSHSVSYQLGSTAPASCDDGTIVDSSLLTGNSHSLGSLSEGQEYSFRICTNNDNPSPDSSSGKIYSVQAGIGTYEFSEISTGSNHSCGIRSSDGQVFCWGEGASGQLGDGDTGDHSSPVAINNTDSFNGISAGSNHSCGIRSSDGQVFCWGEGASGQLGDGDTGDHSSPVAINNTDSFNRISAGESHSCGTRSSDGQVFCWGSGASGQLGDGDTGDHSSPVAINNTDSFNGISAGSNHSCGTRSSDGQVFCWGSGANGRLGDGDTGDHSSPVAINNTDSFNGISAGRDHTCGIRSSDGQVFCWGEGANGRLGDGDTGEHSSPVAINNTDSFNGISAGRFHTCGIRSTDGQVFCWGYGASGQLGDGDTGNHSSPVAINNTDSFNGISAGSYHACGIRSTDGKVFCWGAGRSGQLGDGDAGSNFDPVAIVSTDSFNGISAGRFHTCGIRSTDGKVFCWGDGDEGQLGDGDTGDHSSPVAIDSSDSFNAISTGEYHTCGIRSTDGQVFCWGEGDRGQLGDGDTGNHSSPVAIDSTDSFNGISAGRDHTCAIRSTDGQVFCWGYGASGRLGDGDTGNHSSPVAINNTDSFNGISAGESHSCGIRSSDGQVFCWGYGASGRLGDGDTGNHSSPVAINNTDSFNGISAGESHSCGIRSSDGQVFCWGRGSSGRLGDGDTGNHFSPVAINNTDSFIAISAGDDHTCGIKSSGQVFCWGNQSYGQLGNGNTVSHSSPAAINSPNSFNALSAGEEYACGIKSSGGQVFCWGNRSQGRLGNGQMANYLSPNLVGP